MNYVAHLFLAESDAPHRIGALLADFTVGRIQEIDRRFGRRIAEGVRHHRLIDQYTDAHPQVRHSVDSFKQEFGIYSGIIVDVMFDHFLLVHWNHFAPMEQSVFFSQIYCDLAVPHPHYPLRYRTAVDRILEKRWLDCYCHVDKVAYALSRIDKRFSIPTPLNDTMGALEANYQIVETDFLSFFPDLAMFAHTVDYSF